MRFDLTPWARDRLSPAVLDELAEAEPTHGLIHVGRGRSDWRALVTFNGHVLADARGNTADAAAKAALALLEAPLTV